DAAEALLGKTLELLDPHPRRKRHAVREEDGRALPAAHRVDAPAVVARVPPGLVEGGDQWLAGVGGGAAAGTADDGALDRVGDAGEPGGGPGDDARSPQGAARPAGGMGVVRYQL